MLVASVASLEAKDPSALWESSSSPGGLVECSESSSGLARDHWAQGESIGSGESPSDLARVRVSGESPSCLAKVRRVWRESTSVGRVHESGESSSDLAKVHRVWRESIVSRDHCVCYEC